MRGHIRKRSKGSWTVVVGLPRDPVTGKRRQKWETVRGTRKDAERRLAELLVQVDRGLFPQAAGKTTLGEFFDYFLEIARGKRENTYETYETAFKAFRSVLGGNVKLMDLNPGMLQAVVNQLSRRLKKSTLNLYFSRLKAAMRHAVDVGLIARNPCSGVIVARPEEGEKAVCDDDQANRFLRYCKKHEDEKGYAALFTLLLKTGMRIGEALALRWRDVDFDEGVVHVTRTVSGRGYSPPKSKNGVRKVPLDAGTLNMLSKHRVRQNKLKLLHGASWNQEGLVFCTEEGEKLSHGTVYSAFRRMIKRAGVPEITLHGLRHTQPRSCSGTATP